MLDAGTAATPALKNNRILDHGEDLKMKAHYLLIFIFSALVGCASVPQLTYYSDPPGATLYDQNGKRWGTTPYSITYSAAKKDFDSGECIYLLPTMVRWASGAEADARLHMCPPGYEKQYTFVRPTDVPGRDLDVQVAIELQRGSQQAASQDSAAALLLLQTINGTMNDRKPPPPTTNTTCRTRKVGNTLKTSCR